MFSTIKKHYREPSARQRFLSCLAAAILICAMALAPSAFSDVSSGFEADESRQEEKKQTETKKDQKQKEDEKAQLPQLTEAEAVAEFAILGYGGRKALEPARASIQEEGTVRLATDQGDITGNYNMRSVRQEKSWLDLLRVDLELTPPEEAQKQGAPPSITYIAAFNGASVWTAQNGQYVTPSPEVAAAFRAQLTHDFTTLLRYKEDGSKVELGGSETIVGIDTIVLDLTTPNGEKTRYWISKKFYRVVRLEYELKLSDEQPATKYRVSYYYTPQRIVQNTLVPSRRVTMQDDKFAQEITLTNINYSAKLDPQIFQHLP
ncbi:MAG: hypothetical protein L0229_19680 [Blastocatellia bacterium]|nr:hypothetical protein [Blastocatellia bacterium]